MISIAEDESIQWTFVRRLLGSLLIAFLAVSWLSSSASASEDQRVLRVARNAPPELANPWPASSEKKMNYQEPETFSIDAVDLNGDTLTYVWTLDGNFSPALAPTSVSGQALFRPDASLVGKHTIAVRVSDGMEHSDHQWPIEVNYMNNACNNLQPGQICTFVGKVGVGSGAFPLENPELVNIRPAAVESDGVAGVFISDTVKHLVWYLNLSANSVRRLGATIEPGQIVALVGNGVSGSTPDGSKNNMYKLNRPEGLAWDPRTESLFVAEFNKNSVSRIDSNGVGRTVACSGRNGDAAPEGGRALKHDCLNPTGVEVDSAHNLLYVSVYGGKGALDSSIRAFDISDENPSKWTGFTFMRGATTELNGTIGGTAGADRVWAMASDSRGVLYWLDGHSGCSVRVANTTDSSISFFGGRKQVPPGQTASLTYGGCSAGTDPLANTGFATDSRGLTVVERTPGNIEGWFISNRFNDRITFINNTASTITYGGADVPPYQSAYVTSTAAGFNGEQLGKVTRINEPYGVAYLPFSNSLAFGDFANFRFRSLDLSSPAGKIRTLAGKNPTYGNSGDSIKAPGDVSLYNPNGMSVDAFHKVLYFSDSINGRIRSVDLTTGLVATSIGRGRNSERAGSLPANALDVYMGTLGSRGLTVLESGAVLFADRDSEGAQRSCALSVYNPLSSVLEFLGQIVEPGQVAAVAGNWSKGCFKHTEGQTAIGNSLLDPEGVAFNGKDVFVTLEGAHCIAKISGLDKKITTLAGSCGHAGYEDGILNDTSVRLGNPTAIALDPLYASDGNFYFVDSNGPGVSRLRYVNQRETGVTVSGVTVPGNSVGTLVSSRTPLSAVAAFDSQYCIGRSGHDLGPSNVLCRNRNDDLANTTLRVGSADGSPIKAGLPLGFEQEGVAASRATLYRPSGLSFDGAGNLYISEQGSQKIRKVMRWWQ